MEFLTEFSIPVILGICLCMGYVLKNVVTTYKVDRFIPLIMAVLGIALNIWINMEISPEILLGGMVSGLASTGMYEAFHQFIKKK